MANYEIRIKDAGLESLRSARQRLVDRLGNNQIGNQLVRLDEAKAGALANDLLSLLDAVEQLLARAKRVD